MVTIKDVAQLARVSVTSASYALNGTGTISAVTRQRILDAAETLNYHPNAFARNLKKRKTHTIGVFITRFGGAFYEDILEGIHDAILNSNYELIVCPESRTKRKILSQRQVDGAIVFDSKVHNDVIVRLASDWYPIVVMDRHLDGDYIFPLLLDNQQGTREAFNHLYNQGARKIFFISGAGDSLDNQERMDAFVQEGEKNHVPIPCFSGNFTEESGYNVANSIIDAHDLPEAVFCANDQMAIGFIRALEEHHLRAPDDVAVVGFDDIQVAQYMHPSLSTIGASRFLWGTLAVNWLIDYLENDKPFPTYRIPTQLIVRESSQKSHHPRKDIVAN